jgi:glycine dehydrogenase subunit 2
LVEREGEAYKLNYDLPRSIGQVRGFYGNFLICVRAYAYILAMGGTGLRRASVVAVVNANYVRSGLMKHYHLPYETPSLHECVFNDRNQQRSGVTTLDIAKRLIDYGFHPPTIYFPLVVEGALMVEPTETESRQTLDQFVEAMEAIAEEAKNSPEVLKRAPTRSRITRVDEVTAARKPVLRWNPSGL